MNDSMQYNVSKIADPNVSCWINASAGTGKTTILVKRVLGLLLNGVELKKIICITFTKAAAREMDERIKSRLAKWSFASDEKLTKEIIDIVGESYSSEQLNLARQLFAKSLEEENSIQIKTIHSLCQKILQQFYFESGLSISSKICSQSEIDKIIDEAKISVYKSIIGNDLLESSLRIITNYSSEFSLSEIMKEIAQNKESWDLFFQANSFENLEKNLKSRLDVEESSIQNITEKYITKLNDFKIYKNNHFLEYSERDNNIIREIFAFCELDKFSKLEDLDNYLEIFLTKKHEPRKKIFSKKLTESMPEFYQDIIREQDLILQYVKERDNIKILQMTIAICNFAQVFINLYQCRKNEVGALDYNDLIINTHKLLTQNSLKSWVLYKLDQFYDHFLIDEAQDTSFLQWEVIKELTLEFFVGESSKHQARSIFVVGDEKQSIFGFQGSDFKLFYQMQQYFSKIAQQTSRIFYKISLEKSYRSSQAILTLVDRIYNNNLYKKLVSDNLSDIKHICTKSSPGIIELEPIITHKDISEEEYLVKFVQDLRDVITNQGSKDSLVPSDIMILFQKRDKRYYQLINELSQQDISFYVESYSNIFDQLLIKDLIAFAQFAVMPNDDYNLASLLKSPTFLVDNTKLYNIKFGSEKPLWEIIKESSDYNEIVLVLNQIISFNTSNIYDFFAKIIFEIKPLYKLIQQNNQFYVIDEFLKLIKDFEQFHLSDLQLFLSYLENIELKSKKSSKKEKNKINISTVHSAKGLQAKYVILMDATELPSMRPRHLVHIEQDFAIWRMNANSNNNILSQIKQQEIVADYSEYLRLLYVALTRAEQKIFICGYAKTTNVSLQSWYNIIKSSMVKTGEKTNKKGYLIFY